jgi:hypothetical protein
MASPNTDAAPSPSAVAAVDDFPAAEAPLPSGPGAAPAETAAFQANSEAYRSVPEPVTDSKPTGWDPIRVSTAWPAIRDTPPAVTGPASGARPASAKPAGHTEFSGATGMGVPWGTPPWAEDAADAASPAASPAPTVGRGSAAHSAPKNAASSNSASLTRIAVLAAVLLCALAVLLAVLV